MPQQFSSDIRKRILFIIVLLGIIAGVGMYLVLKAVRQDNYVLLAILPALAMSAIPMLTSLSRLKRQQQSGNTK